MDLVCPLIPLLCLQKIGKQNQSARINNTLNQSLR